MNLELISLDSGGPILKDSSNESLPYISKPIEIVLLLQDLEYGGTQRYAVHLLKNLDRSKFSPHIWVLRGGTDMVPFLGDSRDRVLWLSHSTWVDPVALTNLAWRLVRRRPQILYTLTVVPNIWGRILGNFARVPVIVSSWRDLYPKQYESWMWRLSTRIITNAAALKELHTQRYHVDPQRVSVIPSGVDHVFFEPDHYGKAAHPTVLYIGRLAREKDPLTLVEAFRLTLKRIPEARLQILGNGRLKNKLQSLVKRYNLESHISINPGVKDIRPFLRQSWVFAMTSEREAFPNAMLEAMSSELPVVATRVGGIPEMVDDGETGILVDPHNPEAVADALTRLLTDKNLREYMGQRGREKILAMYSIDRMVRETERVLLEAVNDTALRKTSL
jgi:glycosyltransferase involved in cell wall biosynthesis